MKKIIKITREEKCKLAINKGYVYNPETGIVIGPKGKIISKKHGDGYVILRMRNGVKRYDLFVHQFAWYVVHNEIVACLDHINNIRHDNRICNLRVVTSQENAFNRNCKGYSFCNREKKYVAKIKVNGKQKSLGYYDSENEAKESYLRAKKDLHIINKKGKEIILQNIEKYKRKEPRGYSFDKKRNLYVAKITLNKKTIFLGRFKTKEEASDIYKKQQKCLKLDF